MPLSSYQSDWLMGVIDGLTALSDNRWAMPADHLKSILTELARVIWMATPGAVVEMGCASCRTSLRLAAFLRLLGEGPGRELHLYDSFQGFPEPSPEDQQGEEWRERERSHLNYPVGGPLKLFEEWGDHLLAPIVHAGFFQEVDPTHPSPIAFAFLDGDMYESLKTSLRIVWPRLSYNGVVMIHDYSNPTWPGAKQACEEFFSQEGVKREIGRKYHADGMLLVSKREPGT